MDERTGTATGYDRVRYNPALRRIWPWPAVLLERATAWVDAVPGARWLDAACGEGHLAALLSSRKTLIGLDLDAGRLARSRARGYRLLLRGSVTALPLADGTLDGIVSLETLEHVPDLDGALREFARCLRADGHLLISLPSVTLRSRRQMARTGRPVYCDEKEHVRELSAVPLDGFPHMFVTWERFEAGLTGAGFEVVRAGGVGYVLPPWEGRPAWIAHLVNLLSRETVNAWIGTLPYLRRFPYYRLYLLRRRKAGVRAGATGRP